MQIETFQYLTYDIESYTHKQLAIKACKAGCKWVQLRTKNKTFDEWFEIATEVKDVCDLFNAKLIINDSVDICKAVNAAGVHLGANDIAPSIARRILGNGFIIGGTANTITDIERLNKQGVNYIGCGPFRFTKTKLNLSTIVGLQGYKQLITKMKSLEIKQPLIAIGGIQLNDVDAILETGVTGIAVSSALHGSENMEQATHTFLNKINNKSA
ncbi:UNVERIFIED_CONTAM: hypothetical protein GTU68_039918 [Idotea baltica]|nr:hypothetical protein [Idotea baltica]